MAEDKTIFLRNINYKAVPEDINDALSRFGQIARINILKETFRGETVSRGIGFVEFATVEAQQACLACQEEIEVKGRRLVILKARPRREVKRDTIFVGNIPDDTTTEQLKEVFAQFNPIEARIIVPRLRDRRIFGFVKFSNEEDQTAAGKIDPRPTLGENQLIVRYARRRNYRRPFNGRRRSNRSNRAPRNNTQ